MRLVRGKRGEEEKETNGPQLHLPLKLPVLQQMHIATGECYLTRRIRRETVKEKVSMVERIASQETHA
jgi:hypothetical protein